MHSNLAPVAIFVYNRLKNTEVVIKALQKNTLANKTDVFIFSDGGATKKNIEKVKRVRDYLKTVSGFKSFNIIERERNYYIEKNITEGVTEIINKFGKIIVLEDDGVSEEGFLTFMNKALDFYEYQEKVMHIATFTFIQMPVVYNKTFFWRYSENTGGGWATWKNRWDKFIWFQNEEEGLRDLSEEQKYRMQLEGNFKCLSSLKLNPIPWDICWYIAITKNNGLSVNSPKPLIKNNGLYNGTHFTILNRLLGKSPFEIELIENNSDNIIFEDNIQENKEAIQKLRTFYKNLSSRKRDKILGFFVRGLVILKITKILKKFFK